MCLESLMLSINGLDLADWFKGVDQYTKPSSWNSFKDYENHITFALDDRCPKFRANFQFLLRMVRQKEMLFLERLSSLKLDQILLFFKMINSGIDFKNSFAQKIFYRGFYQSFADIWRARKFGTSLKFSPKHRYFIRRSKSSLKFDTRVSKPNKLNMKLL